MRSGYEIVWTDNALSELAAAFKYLEENWTEKELNKLSEEIERTIGLISNNPNLFPEIDNRQIRKATVDKLNTIYYRKKENSLEILSFFFKPAKP